MASTEKMSLLQFQEHFCSEEACREHLFRMKWPNGFRCPACGAETYYEISKRNLYQCQSCRHQTSLTAGTVMHKTRTPLRIWFWCIYSVAHDKRGRSALALQQLLNISYYRAWTMLHKIRSAMASRDAKYQLSGIIEMDEGYFGSPRSGKCGRGTDKSKVAVTLAVTDEGKPCFVHLDVISQASIKELMRVAETRIAKGATVITDGLGAYQSLTKHGYTHSPKNYKDQGPEYLKWIHTIISNAKAFIAGTYHGLPDKHLQVYLDEFSYRFNRRRHQSELFNRLLVACMNASPLTYAELTQ